MTAPASAEDITLISKSGGLTVSGTLLAFDGQTYQVETDLGRITTSDSDLTCQGQGSLGCIFSDRNRPHTTRNTTHTFEILRQKRTKVI